jgi:hypothetical protein
VSDPTHPLPTERFIGGIRTQTLGNATWPFIALEIGVDGVRVRRRGLAKLHPLILDEDYLWEEITLVESARGWPPSSLAHGVRFETARGPFVFWALKPDAVLAAVERLGPSGLIRQGPPKRTWFKP